MKHVVIKGTDHQYRMLLEAIKVDTYNHYSRIRMSYREKFRKNDDCFQNK